MNASQLRLLARRLAVAWLLVSLLPGHNFILRSNQAALSQVGLEPLFEVAYFGAIGLFALTVVRDLEPRPEVARPPVVLFLFPVWAVASTAWSATQFYAFARGAEMVVIATLGWATLALGRTSGAALAEVTRTYLRWFLATVVVLVGLGVSFGPIRVPASEENLTRFTWIGAHPNAAGLMLALAITVVVFAPTSVLRWSAGPRAVVGLVLTVALYDNHSRTGWACLLIGLAVGYLLSGRIRRPRWHPVRTPLTVLGVGALGAVLAPAVVDYALRGRGSESFFSANGRLGLFEVGFDALRTPFDWVCGLGYGAARSVFVAEISWARTAHNSVLSALVSVGVVGVVALAAAVVVVGLGAFRLRLGRRDPLDRTLVAFAAVLGGGAMTSDVLAEPNIGLAGLCLLAAVVLARREALAREILAVPGDAADQSPTAASTVSQPSPGDTS